MKKFFLLFFAIPFFMEASNIQVNNVQIGSGQNAYMPTITCDVSWDNGWRINGGTEFMDAAWLFVKYRTAAMPVWRHAYILNTSISAGNLAFEAQNLKYGVTVMSSVDTVGTISGTVQLTLDSLLSLAYGLEVQVHAIEMVHVPEGEYYVGDGNIQGQQYIDYSLKPNGIFQPYKIYQDSLIDFTTFDRPQPYSGSVITVPFLSNKKAFYMMKYEISYEQYTAFLNTLERTEQNLRTRLDLNAPSMPYNRRFVMSNTAGVLGRSAIAVDLSPDTVVGPVTFYCDLNNNTVHNETDDGMNLGAFDLSIADVLSYADWCGLIIPTEFQYEKACRGPLMPVKSEYAWGHPNINVVSEFLNTNHLTNAGTAQETYINPLPYTAHIGTNGFGMAQRCGINATPNSETRGQASASYYGFQDLTGGASEVYCLQGYSTINQLNNDPNAATPGTATGLSDYIIKGSGYVSSAAEVEKCNVSNRSVQEPINSTMKVGGRLAL